VLTAVVTQSGGSLSVLLATSPPTTTVEAETTTGAETHTETAVDEGPSPIAPEIKELAWSAGAFIVFAVILRYVAFPKLRKGMTARYDSIRKGFEDADALRADAKGEVARYDQALAAVKAEAALKVEAARQQLEAERQDRLAVVNAGIAERRAAAAAEAEAAREAQRDQVTIAIGTVAARTVELATGRSPAFNHVADVVREVHGAGATR